MDITLKMPEVLAALEDHLRSRGMKTSPGSEIELKHDVSKGGACFIITEVEFVAPEPVPVVLPPLSRATAPTPSRGLDRPPVTLEEIEGAGESIHDTEELPADMEEYDGRAPAPPMGPTVPDPGLDNMLRASRQLERTQADVRGRRPGQR